MRLRLIPLFALCIGSATHAAPSAESVFEQVARSVVAVRAINAAGDRAGSGVVLGPGRVATNCHVTKGSQHVEVRAGQTRYTARLDHADDSNDLCVLDVPGLAGAAIPTTASKSLKVGQKVYAIGNPKGMDRSMSEGIVSALRTRSGSPLIQTTAAISPGSSGGGLFDAQGRLIGITTFKLADGESLNFAVSADLIPGLGHGTAPASGKLSRQRLGAQDWRDLLKQEQDPSAKAELCRQWTQSAPRELDAWRCLADAAVPQKEQLAAARTAHKLAPRDAAVVMQYALLLAFEVPDDEEVMTIQSLLAGPAVLDHQQQAQLHVRLGNALSRQGNDAAAIGTYERATVLNPKLGVAWEQLALARMNEPQQPAAARAALQQAIRINPHDATLWTKLAFTYVHERKYEEAITAQRRAIELEQVSSNPMDDIFPESALERKARYHVDLSQLYLQLGQHENVIRAATAAISTLKNTPALKERVRAAIYGAAAMWAQEKRESAVNMLRSATKLCDEWVPSKAVISSDMVNEGISSQCSKAWYHSGLAAKSLKDDETIRVARMRLEILDPALAEKLRSGSTSQGE